MEAARHPWPALGVLLMRDGRVTREQLEAVLAEQVDRPSNRVSSQRLGQLLVDRGLVTSAQIARLIAEQHELPYVELSESDLSAELARRLPEELARRCSAVPIRAFPDGSLVVAVADPTEIGCFDDVRRALAVPIRFAIATQEAVAGAIDVAHSQPQAAEHVQEESDPDPVGDAAPIFVGEPLEAAAAEPRWPVFGSLLLGNGLVTEQELDAALAQQRLSRTRLLGEILISRGVLTEREVAGVLAEQHDLPYLDLDDTVVDPAAASLLPVDLARRYSALPLAYLPNGSVLVAVGDPAAALSSDELRVAVGGAVQFGVAASDQIHTAIVALATDEHGTPPVPEPGYTEPDVPGVADVHELEPSSVPAQVPEEETRADAPADEASLVDAMVREALALGSSSIHFTPRPDGLTVHARVDGVLRELRTIPEEDQRHRVLSELATLGRIDGRTRGRVVAVAAGERTVAIRVVCLPTIYGERVALRVLEEASSGESLVDLIPADGPRAAVGEAIERQSGMLVICGSAGSGRTRTLYAAVRELRSRGRAVMTIEEAMEGRIDGIDQTEVDPLAGLTLASGLHAILGSDPDVVAVDELLDPESARLAARGARAGHLVLLALEADTASAGVRRLLELGVEPSTLSTVLSGVVAQRLVRCLCADCRESYYATHEELAALGRPPEESGRRLLGRSRGCAACGGTGYQGRVGVFEALPLLEEIRALVAGGASADEIEQASVAAGMRTLHEAAVELCLEGMTTPAEISRVFPPVRSQLRLS